LQLCERGTVKKPHKTKLTGSGVKKTYAHGPQRNGGEEFWGVTKQKGERDDSVGESSKGEGGLREITNSLGG